MSPRANTSKTISGPNGSGKTSVFRVLRDIWPTVCGRLSKPSLDIKELGSGNGIFFVPQRPYTCLGTLRDQIIYPLSKEEAEKRAAKLYTNGKSFTSKGRFDSQINTLRTQSVELFDDLPISHGLLLQITGETSAEAGNILDVHLKTILENVRLVYLLERDESGWDATTNWEDILSLGEQQRLGMVSLL